MNDGPMIAAVALHPRHEGDLTGFRTETNGMTVLTDQFLAIVESVKSHHLVDNLISGLRGPHIDVGSVELAHHWTRRQQWDEVMKLLQKLTGGPQIHFSGCEVHFIAAYIRSWGLIFEQLEQAISDVTVVYAAFTEVDDARKTCFVDHNVVRGEIVLTYTQSMKLDEHKPSLESGALA